MDQRAWQRHSHTVTSLQKVGTKTEGSEMMDLPTIALSVRQPWAWAIIYGGKDIENRSRFAVTKGKMNPRRVAVHAALGMTQDEYQVASAFMRSIGVECPAPSQLIRGGIIGAVDVAAVVKASASKWFFGPRGLVLANPTPCDPIPATGALGYFQWRRHDAGLALPPKWMLKANPAAAQLPGTAL